MKNLLKEYSLMEEEEEEAVVNSPEMQQFRHSVLVEDDDTSNRGLNVGIDESNDIMHQQELSFEDDDYEEPENNNFSVFNYNESKDTEHTNTTEDKSNMQHVVDDLEVSQDLGGTSMDIFKLVTNTTKVLRLDQIPANLREFLPWIIASISLCMIVLLTIHLK